VKDISGFKQGDYVTLSIYQWVGSTQPSIVQGRLSAPDPNWFVFEDGQRVHRYDVKSAERRR
jgi:hypothetical protein